MLKNLLYTALLLIFFGCSNSKNECENEQINPNGESELALLMRDLHQNTIEIKNNLFLNQIFLLLQSYVSVTFYP